MGSVKNKCLIPPPKKKPRFPLEICCYVSIYSKSISFSFVAGWMTKFVNTLTITFLIKAYEIEKGGWELGDRKKMQK